MQIRLGYEFRYFFPRPASMILTLHVHQSRVADLVYPDHMLTDPMVQLRGYQDGFGNWCTRLSAPAGNLRIWADTIINDSGLADRVAPGAYQLSPDALPDDTLVYLLGSRYCETDQLSDTAWRMFGNGPTGWERVQGICDFVHDHMTFGYEYSNSTKSALGAYNERCGVCRDFAHLAITLCRCMNIPARYCTGYLGDIDVPASDAPMDFAAWMEVYLDGGWYTFDPRNNAARVGRVLVARGRDAADVALNTTFGENTLESFFVHTDEVA